MANCYFLKIIIIKHPCAFYHFLCTYRYSIFFLSVYYILVWRYAVDTGCFLIGWPGGTRQHGQVKVSVTVWDWNILQASWCKYVNELWSYIMDKMSRANSILYNQSPVSGWWYSRSFCFTSNPGSALNEASLSLCVCVRVHASVSRPHCALLPVEAELGTEVKLRMTGVALCAEILRKRHKNENLTVSEAEETDYS